MPDTTKRGLAAASPETRERVARSGGRAAQRAGTCHRWTREEAAVAGRIGGAKAAVTLKRLAQARRQAAGQ